MDITKILEHNYLLASQSPRRKYLLNMIGIDFNIIQSHFEEDSKKPFSPFNKYAEKLAEGKAEFSDYKNQNEKFRFVIAADTIVVFQNKVLGKPRSKSEAALMLKTLSNNWHTVYTAIAVLDRQNNNSIKTFSVGTDVLFDTLSNELITWYINTKEPFDKAGAYGIQGYGSIIVKALKGCYFNVMGFPINAFIQHMHTYLEKEIKQ